MRLTVSFSKEYEHEFKYLTELNNASDYVCRAVKEKIERDANEDQDFEKRVREIVEKVLSEKKIQEVLSQDCQSNSEDDGIHDD